MDAEADKLAKESMDGDWCLVDLSDEMTEEATKVAHALGMDVHAFMCLALEEKLARFKGDERLQDAIAKVKWEPQLKG